MTNNLRLGIIVVFFLVPNLFSQSKGGHWNFDNDSIDTAIWDQLDDTGRLNDPAYFSDEEPVTGYNSYLGLDSLNTFDFFQVDDSNDLDFDNEDIGISLWIRPVVIKKVHFIVNKGVQDAVPKTTNYALRISDTKTLEFLIRDETDQARVASSGIPFTVGEWMFIAAFYDYSDKKVYFWDKPTAQPDTSVDFDYEFFSNDDPLAIGAWSKNDSLKPSITNVEGSIDDVRISGRLEDIIPSLSSVQSGEIRQRQTSKAEINVSPNPVSISGNKGHVRFQLNSGHLNSVDYTIYNILGQKVFQANSGNTARSFNIRWNMKSNMGYHITPGIYFIEISGMKNRLIKKFLVIK